MTASRLVPMVVMTTLTACAQTLPPGASTRTSEAVTTEAVVDVVASAPTPITYPQARRGDVVETQHGVSVPDPYRWLEDMESPEARAWVAAEDALTSTVLAKNASARSLRARIAELFRHDVARPPEQRGGRYFWRHQDAQKDQAVVALASSLDAAPSTLFDPSALATDGSVALAGFTPSRDGKRVAYGLSQGGGDWQTWRIRDVASGQDLPDELSHIKYYEPGFSRNGKAIFYASFPAPAAGRELVEPDHDCKIYRHMLGTAAAKDTVVYARPDQPSWQFMPVVTRDGRFLVIMIGDGEVGDRGQEQIVYLELDAPGAKPVALIDRFEAEYELLGNDGPVLYFQTSLEAPNKRIIAIDTRKPGRDKWKEIVPAGADAIDHASLAGRQLFVTTLRDAHSVVTSYDLTGRLLREVALPGAGSAWGFSGALGDTETFYAYTSYTEPQSVYRYDLATGESRLWKGSHAKFDPATLEATQIFFPSKDGTRVPMTIVAKRGLTHDGDNPVLLTGYGFAGISFLPEFEEPMIAWLERGGIYAVVNIRGGGEYGEAWHQAAVHPHKQVAVDDFLAAAEWLIANRYTSAQRLGAVGTSGGGMLVGIAVTQRPNLFGAVAPIAGVHDLLRFQLFGEGAGWQGDLGSADDPNDFRALLAMSPLHNVRPGTHYPPMLVITSDHDVRVAPLHSYKFAATLQAAQTGPAPVVLRVQTQSGHGFGSTLTQKIDQSSELLAFFANALDLPPAK